MLPKCRVNNDAEEFQICSQSAETRDADMVAKAVAVQLVAKCVQIYVTQCDQRVTQNMKTV